MDGICSQCGGQVAGVRYCMAGPMAHKAPRPKVAAEQRVHHGLGDKTEQALAAVGITQDSWQEFKKTYGLPPGCNCEARKQWLNELGEKLGEKAKDALAFLWPSVKRLNGPTDRT